MDLSTVDSKQMAGALPQIVPAATCFRCDVCCRFPEVDSFLRPYFTREEIAGTVRQGIPESYFPDTSGSQITLVRHPTDEGYLCPAFDPTSGRCGIYEGRPLDCQLYPLALMWDESGREVLLGWDTKCPFLRDEVPETIRRHGDHVAELLATELVIERIVAHPRLIGRFQDDVVVLRRLPHLTGRVHPPSVDPRPHLLTPSDLPRLTRALAQSHVLVSDTLAAFSFPYHYMCTSLLPYWWVERQETLFLFAQSADGWFMPLPPLGPRPLDQTVGEAFVLMRQWNGGSPVSRIENVTESQKQLLNGKGIEWYRKEGDYLYDASALAALSGDHYKSQRALCNRAEREHTLTSEPYRDDHQEACVQLHRQWAIQKRQGQLDSMGKMLLEDTDAAHLRVFADYDRIGLSGTVAKVKDAVVAYTFGYWLTPQTWCILLEVADRSIPGLAQWLFRDTCRRAMSQGAAYINTMDDAGLPGLRQNKLAYHPTRVLDSWIITRMAT